MTNREYIEEMNRLVVKLTDACNNFGFQSDAYNAVLREIATCAALFNRSQRRRPWGYIVTIIVLVCLAAWLFYKCLCSINF